MSDWDRLTGPQKCTLASMAQLASKGLLYMPKGPQWKTIRRLVAKGLALAVVGDARNMDTGEEGPAFNMTWNGAKTAAQEPGHDRCHLTVER